MNELFLCQLCNGSTFSPPFFFFHLFRLFAFIVLKTTLIGLRGGGGGVCWAGREAVWVSKTEMKPNPTTLYMRFSSSLSIDTNPLSPLNIDEHPDENNLKSQF